MSVPVRELSKAEFPPKLGDLPAPPRRLWIRGELPRGPAVAIVGSRRATDDGRRFAEELARTLASVGVAILSGGAVGIDTAAHLGALAAGGTTVVVSPSGFGAEYPEENRPLFEQVVEAGGAFLTSFPEGTPARPHRFLARNAQLVALSDALVVVETRYRGGARNAALHARKLGRPLLVVPGAPWMPSSEGCIQEIARGGRILAGPNDVLSAIGLPKIRKSERGQGGLLRAARRAGPPDPARDRVLAALERGPLHPDGLCLEAAVPPAELQAILLTLTLEGIVVSDPSGGVSLVTTGID